MNTFPREDDENGLRDFLGGMRVAGVPQRDGINFVDVPRDKGGEGFAGIARDIFAQPSVVIQFMHLYLNAADWEKVTRFFFEKENNHASLKFSLPGF